MQCCVQINPDADSLQRLKALRGEAATPASAPAAVAEAADAAAEHADTQPASRLPEAAAPAAAGHAPEDDSDEEALGGIPWLHAVDKHCID